MGSESSLENDEPALGILGGLGPEATIHFTEELLSATPAQQDQDHIETIVYNDPKIPDRNDAILRDGVSPLPRLLRNARRLVDCGAEVLAIPSNTTHYYYDDIDNNVSVPVLHMLELVEEQTARLGAEQAGLLSTSTVMNVGIYEAVFADSGVELVYPDDGQALMEAIYAIKAGDLADGRQTIQKTIDALEATGVDTIILGCTEFSLFSFDNGLEFVDPTILLANACVDWVETGPSTSSL